MAPAPMGMAAPAPPGPPAPAPFTTYNGSLTTPPCAEDVIWFVRQQPLQMGLMQSGRLTEAIVQMTSGFGNWRALRPQGTRVLSTVIGSPQPPLPPMWPGVYEHPHMTDREYITRGWAMDALKKAKIVADSVRWMDMRARAEADAMTNAFQPTPPPR